jgi:hypothetical protein
MRRTLGFIPLWYNPHLAREMLALAAEQLTNKHPTSAECHLAMASSVLLLILAVSWMSPVGGLLVWPFEAASSVTFLMMNVAFLSNAFLSNAFILIATGAANQEVAQALMIELSTVKKHVSNLLSKLGATSRTQASVLARHADTIPPNTAVRLRAQMLLMVAL